MGNDESTPQSGLSRRDLLRRGAVVGGTLVWAVPAMEVLSLTSAHASNPSGGSQDQQGRNQNRQGQDQQRQNQQGQNQQGGGQQ